MYITFVHSFRLLFPDRPDLVTRLFELSGVQDTLIPQKLTLKDFEQLCDAYTMLSRDQRSAGQEDGSVSDHGVEDEVHQMN